MKCLSLSKMVACSAFMSLLVTACQTSSVVNSHGIPAAKYRLGGGYQVDFTAPCKGIAYVVEEKSRKVIHLKSLDPGESFSSEIEPEGEEIEKNLGIKPSMAKFTFYFVPVHEAVPALKTLKEE